ncbi:MAG: M1 family metallopeptidase, partial [bacterium]
MKSVITNFELPGSKPNYNPDKNLNVKHILLDLAIDLEKRTFVGSSSLTLEVVTDGLDYIKIDAIQMNIESVKINKKDVEFNHDGEVIHVVLVKKLKTGEKIDLVVDYNVINPKMGLNFTGPTQYYPDKPWQVWSQGESEGSRYWFPCLDQPKQITSVEIKARFAENFTALSNGRLIETKLVSNKDAFVTKLSELTKSKADTKFKLSHWRQDKPHPTYLTALIIGEFEEIKDKLGGLEVNYYTSKNKADLLKLTAQKTPQMIDFYNKKFGVEFAWDKYSQVWVSDFIWGGMENTSITVNTDRALTDKKASIDYPFGEVLIAHELAHQWFGDLVAIDHWSNLWVKEGIVTYCESLWWEHEYGQDEFNYYRLQEQREYLDGEGYKRPVVTNVYRHVEDLYDRHSYTKAGTVFHMVRTLIGDKAFELFLKYFISDNTHKNTQAVDILRAAEKASGKNLLPLFDQYLFSKGHPEFKISYSWDQEHKTAKLTVKQTQVEKKDDFENLFRLKLPLAFGTVKSKKAELTELEIQIDKPEQDFYIPLAKKPDFISFDHGNNFLKKVELDFPFAELNSQLLYNPDPIARIYAAENLAKKSTLQILESLAESFKQEKFWAVRAEITTNISKIKLDQTVDVLANCLQDKDARVRTEAIKGLAEFKSEKSFELIKKAFETEKQSYFARGQALKTLGVIAASLAGDWETQIIAIASSVLEEKPSWNEVNRSYALQALSQLNTNEQALEIILQHTKIGVAEQLRQTAIAVLAKAVINQPKHLQEKVLDCIEEVSGESQIWYEMAIISSLSGIASPRSIRILKTIANSSMMGRTQRKAEEAIETVEKKLGNQENILEIRKELDQIQKDNQELRSKLELLQSFEKKDGAKKLTPPNFHPLSNKYHRYF